MQGLFQLAALVFFFPLSFPLGLILSTWFCSFFYKPFWGFARFGIWLLKQKWWWFPGGWIAGLVFVLLFFASALQSPSSSSSNVSSSGSFDNAEDFVVLTVNAVSTTAQQTLVARQPTPVPTLVTLVAALITQMPPTTPPTEVPPTVATVLPANPPTAEALPVTPVPPTGVSPPATLSGQMTRPNGSVLHAQAFWVPPTIDGNLQEWGTLPYGIDQIVFSPENWAGGTDQSGSFAAGWDANFLYVAAAVTDDVHVQTQQGELMYQGDSLELQIDADLAGDFTETRINGDDYQLGLSPGDFIALPPSMYLWSPAGVKGVPVGVYFAALDNGQQGYTIELALPWTILQVAPVSGQTFGFAFNSSDNDTPNTSVQQSMLSSVVTRKLLNPTTWGTLQLDP